MTYLNYFLKFTGLEVTNSTVGKKWNLDLFCAYSEEDGRRSLIDRKRVISVWGTWYQYLSA